MPAVTDFTIGKQATLVVISGGNVVGTASLTDFMFKQTVIKLKSRPLNQPPIHKNLPDGWSGDFGVDRIDSTLDDYFAAQEDNYWQGGSQDTIYIQQTITENDGSVTQYRFDGVTLELTSGGTWKADERVQQKVAYEATRRRKVQ